MSKKSPAPVHDVTDVTPRTTVAEQVSGAPAAEAKIPDPALRSLLTDQGFAIGFAPGESVKEDGTFTLSHSLMYKDTGLAIIQLESVLNHARAVHMQQIFNAGVAHGQQAVAEQPVKKAAPAAKTSPAKKAKRK